MEAGTKGWIAPAKLKECQALSLISPHRLRSSLFTVETWSFPIFRFSDFSILDFAKILVDEKNNFGVTREFTAGYGIALLRIPTLYVPECASPCDVITHAAGGTPLCLAQRGGPRSNAYSEVRWMIRQRPEGSFRRVAHA
jgi:hypothetical protein